MDHNKGSERRVGSFRNRRTRPHLYRLNKGHRSLMAANPDKVLEEVKMSNSGVSMDI